MTAEVAWTAATHEAARWPAAQHRTYRRSTTSTAQARTWEIWGMSNMTYGASMCTRAPASSSVSRAAPAADDSPHSR